MYADSRWPWALLEGAYDGKKDNVDMKSIVMALAGEELISISNSDADEYCAKHLHRWSIDADRQGRSCKKLTGPQ